MSGKETGKVIDFQPRHDQPIDQVFFINIEEADRNIRKAEKQFFDAPHSATEALDKAIASLLKAKNDIMLKAALDAERTYQ